MRFSTSFLLVASALLASALAWGQTQIPKTQIPATNDSDFLLVRMSFNSTWVADYGAEGLKGSPQICFSVDRSGHYRMRRLTMKVGSEPFPGNPDATRSLEVPHVELLQGALSPGELAKLEKLLEDPEFRKLTGPGPRLLLSGAETLVAEVPREDGVQRVVVSDADGENPFPRSAERIIGWLQHFKAERAAPLDVSGEDICPSQALQPVKPATAMLHGIVSSGACVR